jgi:hypothetical protein
MTPIPPFRNFSSTPQHSPQLTARQFSSATAEDVEDLLQQMELEDDAFAATEQRMANSGWSTEIELVELRAKRQAVRKEWEGRIDDARKKRRGSDRRGSDASRSIGTVEPTPVITLYTTPNTSSTAIPSVLNGM